MCDKVIRVRRKQRQKEMAGKHHSCLLRKVDSNQRSLRLPLGCAQLLAVCVGGSQTQVGLKLLHMGIRGREL